MTDETRGYWGEMIFAGDRWWILPDEELHRWGDVFTANPILRKYCTFEHFLRHPAHWLERLGLGGGTESCEYAPEFLPLLPAQARIQARLAAVEFAQELAP